MRYVLKFDEPLATEIGHSGGKGANLARLTQEGFPVPPGFIVTARGYDDFITAGGELLRSVSNFSFEVPTRLRSESERLRASLAKLALPTGLVDDVHLLLGEYPEDQSFSVRSSSTMEDLSSAAFAGQHDTFLNCSGADAILEKIKSCFLSLWADRALAYRQRQGFDHLMASMAVVVQEMIPCTAAGVGFSINPVSGDLGEIVINANFGLGESVVSGEGEVDQYSIDKAMRSVRSSRIGTKTRKVVAVPGGTKEETLSPDKAATPCLDPKTLAQLADLICRVEESYRFPQDIEWGLVDGRLYLLQSRPVTTIPPRWTRDESAERFPTVITPLTWDFVEKGFHQSLNFSLQLMGYPPFNGKWFGMHGHYIYGNQNAVDLYLRRMPFRPQSLDELRAAIPHLRDKFRWVQELPILWSRDLDYYLIKIGEFMATPLDDLDTEGVWAFVREVEEHGAKYFLPNIAISITQGTLYRLLHDLLRMVVGAHDAPRLFDGLLAYCETKTGAINKELFEMALQVRAHPELEQVLLQRNSQEIVERDLASQFPEVKARFQKFLRDHGHREVDFDVYHPTWVEIPWVVLDQIRLILQAPVQPTPVEKERELRIRAQQSEFELLSKLPQDFHFFFHEILRLTRAYTSLDDLEHYQTTRLTLPLRKGLRELGRRLVAQGVLKIPMDVFFAHSEELDAAIRENMDSRWKELAASIRREKQTYLEDKQRTPSWVLGEEASEQAAGDELAGLPGSPGKAEGPVFIVLGPDDFARFPKGSVLVARTTNPTWTPLFYGAVAVITESGGPLSHGAVTAREMQIPAIMSVRSSLSKLKNGQYVRVDGTSGKVYLLGKPPENA